MIPITVWSHISKLYIIQSHDIEKNIKDSKTNSITTVY